jgi:hypothetical protein
MIKGMEKIPPSYLFGPEGAPEEILEEINNKWCC